MEAAGQVATTIREDEVQENSFPVANFWLKCFVKSFLCWRVPSRHDTCTKKNLKHKSNSVIIVASPKNHKKWCAHAILTKLLNFPRTCRELIRSRPESVSNSSEFLPNLCPELVLNWSQMLTGIRKINDIAVSSGKNFWRPRNKLQLAYRWKLQDK